MSGELFTMVGILAAIFAGLFLLFRFLINKAKEQDAAEEFEVTQKTNQELQDLYSNATGHPSFLARVEAEATKRGIVLEKEYGTEKEPAPQDRLGRTKGEMYTAAGIAAIAVVANTIAAIFASPGRQPGYVVAAAIIAVLAFGVYKHSRFCAVLLFSYWCIELLMAIWLAISSGSVNAMTGKISWLVLIYLWGGYTGLKGTFAYHRLRTAQQ